MSSTIGSSSYGTLDRMLVSASSLRDQYATLQEQTTSGLVSQSYFGLATVSSQVLDLTAESSQNTAYTQAILNAQGKASIMQNALSQLGTLVSTMASNALSVTGSSPGSAVTGMAQQAGQALAQLVSVLNTTYGGDYVFAGADTSNPPVPSPGSVATSGMYTGIGAAVSALATIPSTPPVATMIANTVAIASSTAAGTTIFSPYLAAVGTTATPVTVRIGPSDNVILDLPANRNVGAVSDPSINGTGSAISDIIRSLAVMANSTSAMASNPDFQKLIQDAATTLTSAGATLAQESGRIGQTQNALTAATASHASMQTLLTNQLTNLTNVDMATAISHLQTVNSQLQASYKVLGEVSSLNLASFL
jgi:flagellar hook-associated protein 3 FlgL